MPNNTPSATKNSDDEMQAQWQAIVERIAILLDPDYPAIVIGPVSSTIEEPDLDGPQKPAFVRQDNIGWK